MQFVEIKDKNKWNDFVGAQEHAEFLQSWEWGEFLEKAEGSALSGAEGNVRRFGVEEDGNLVAVISLVKRSLPLGMNYFYAPRGPIFNYQFSIINLRTFLFFEIEKIAKKENIIFLRIEPKERIDNCKLKIVDSIAIQVSKTIILDLSLSEDDLLKKMHQKTRYNIRLAEKKGVKIK